MVLCRGVKFFEDHTCCCSRLRQLPLSAAKMFEEFASNSRKPHIHTHAVHARCPALAPSCVRCLTRRFHKLSRHVAQLVRPRHTSADLGQGANDRDPGPARCSQWRQRIPARASSARFNAARSA